MQLLPVLKKGDSPPYASSPDLFTADLSVHNFVLLFLWFWFTWWIWIPLRIQEESNSSVETNISAFSEHATTRKNSQDPPMSSTEGSPQNFHKNILFGVNKIGEGKENDEQEQTILGSSHEILDQNSLRSLRLESTIEIQITASNDIPSNGI